MSSILIFDGNNLIYLFLSQKSSEDQNLREDIQKWCSQRTKTRAWTKRRKMNVKRHAGHVVEAGHPH